MRTALLLPLLPVLALSAQDSPSFLWEARSESGTVYLLGSIHLLRPDAYPLPGAIEKAYEKADVLVLELDLGEMQTGAMALVQRGLYADGSALCDHVADSTCALVETRLASLDMLRPTVARAEPWLAGMLLTTATLQAAGYRADLGLDLHFYTRAIADGKPVRGLETMAQQIDFFDTMPAEAQEAFLHYTLAEIDRAVEDVDAMAAWWKTGDADALYARAAADLDAQPGVRERLLTARNRAWVAPIETLVAEGHAPLVVVGALHLLGPDGLIALLEQRGFTIEQR